MSSTRTSGRQGSLALALSALLVVAGIGAPAAMAVAGNSLRIVAPTTNTTVGGSFNVTVVGNSAGLVSGTSASLTFDKSKLQVTAIAKGAEWTDGGAIWLGYPSGAGLATFLANANTAGKIPAIAASFLDGSSALAAGDHTLLTVSFSVSACGDSSLGLPLGGSDGSMLDGEVATYGQGLTVSATGGTVSAPCPVGPKLHLRKVVVNDNGGTTAAATWTLTANGAGANDLSGHTPVDSGAGLTADTFALSETGPAGYTASAWVCVGGNQSGSNITVANGAEATCTITNNDLAPALHLRKVVVNNNGGTATASAWTLTANGGAAGTLSGKAPVDSGATFKAGTYALSEAGPAGYTASAWVCVGGSQVGSNITIAIGQSATCTITNDDVAPPAAAMGSVASYQLGSTAPLTWSATPGAAALANYDVRYRKAAWNGAFGAYVTWKSATTLKTAAFSMSPGYTYCYSVLARDVNGRVSAWTADKCTVAPLDDRSLSTSGTWSRKSSSSFYRGTYTQSTKVNAKLIRTSAKFKRLYLVATTCPTCGSVKVYLGSTLLKSISLKSSKTVNKKVITVYSSTALKSGTVSIKVSTSGKAVKIDGLALGQF